MSLLRLHNPVKHYDWGSRRAIPELLGVDNPQNRPWAELWMGAHPQGPSQTDDGESLLSHIERTPRAMLGKAVQAQYGRLPFLFKILAAEAPLSIQCHPDREQARAGFAEENARGVALDASDRNYKDDNHKPELLLALGEFWALQGFRPVDEIIELFDRAHLDALQAPVQALRLGDLAGFYASLMMSDDATRIAALAQLTASLSMLDPVEARWTAELLRAYPGDLGVLAPLYLNIVRLERGQCIYIGARELHAYLRGVGLELMANSDNVLRGGLTTKHVDRRELLQTLSYRSGPPSVLAGVAVDGDTSFEPPCPEFRLRVCPVAGPRSLEIDGPAIVLAVSGQARLETGDDEVLLASGQSVFVPFEIQQLRVDGQGELAVASCPARP